VAQLLAQHRDIRLAEAQLDMELRWYQRGDYGFWHHHARPHLAAPDNHLPLDEFPDGMCYFASEWLEPASGDRVILFEQHH
jgi:hypothetical protein